MSNPIRFRRGALPVFVMCFMALCAQAAGDDPYLKAINAEGNRLEFLDKAKAEQDQLLRQEAAERNASARPAAPSPAEPGNVASPVTQGAFEEALRKRFPHNYVLYDLMTPDEKRQVFAEYRKKNVEGTARFIPAVMKIITISNASSANRIRIQKQSSVD